MSESYLAETWLYDKLSKDTQLKAAVTGVYADLAPEGTAFPYVIFSYNSGRDVNTLNGQRIHAWATYLVKVITDKPSYSAIDPIADRIDELLHRATGTLAGGLVLSCVRQELVRYTETIGTIQFRHLGGMYRLQVQSS